MQGRLNTRQKLHSWGRVDNPNCVLCDQEEETEKHLCFECDFTKGVVDRVFLWAGISCRKESLIDWLEWFAESPRKKSHVFGTKLLALNAVVYNIWRARNLKIHEEVTWSMEDCASVVIIMCKERIVARKK